MRLRFVIFPLSGLHRTIQTQFRDPELKGMGALDTTQKQNGFLGQAENTVRMSKLSDYDIYQQLGQGTFGVVTKARQKSTGKLVALKKFIIKDKKEGFPITAFREITIMKKLKNLNVLQIVDMIHDDSNNSSFFYTVSPYISSDLNGLLNNPRINLSLSQIKCLLKQILLGINYVHLSGYLHRDIKTANILLDHFGIVKIADFGLARLFHGKPPSTSDGPPGGGKFEYTGLVVTRWYRPPELLLGDRKYTTSVDMWGIGCVFGELFTRRPILEGKSDIHQAEIIFKLLGSPTAESYPNCHLINRNNIDLKNNYPRTLESAFAKILSNDENALTLLSGMLTLDPMKRYNALKCLDSPFFTTDPLPSSHYELSDLEESHESDVKRFREESSNILPKQSNNKFPSNNPNSLNHSKYGVDASAYMSRQDSNINIPIHTNNNEYNSLKSSKSMTHMDNTENQPHHSHQSQYRHSRLPKHQQNQISQHPISDGPRGYKRSHNNGYYSGGNRRPVPDHYDDYYDGGVGGDYGNDYGNDYIDSTKRRPRGRYDYERYDYNNGYNYNSGFLIDSRKSDEYVESSKDVGKELYGSGSGNEPTGLNALTKVLMKKKKNSATKNLQDVNKTESNEKS